MSKNQVRKPNPNATRRSAARLAAVQALYSMEITGVTAEEAITEFRERQEAEPPTRLAEPDGELMTLLVRGATAEGGLLDDMIGHALARDWTVDRLESVLRAILRAGAFELKARPQTPARVVITEFVDVAHAFYAGPEPKMVNAVLDKIARVLRSDEFEADTSRPT
ncbi:MAG TPA: transcription antitermination factor NusB [Magnetospirillum sp.]|nr:transcription antitermination factor NusB [Magnetospirillum sp.]